MQTKLFPFPIFRPQGVLVFSAPLFVPIVGFLLNIEVDRLLNILFSTYSALTLFAFYDAYSALKLVKSYSISLEGTPRGLSGVKSELSVKGRAPGAHHPVKIALRIVLPPGIISNEFVKQFTSIGRFIQEFSVLPVERGRYKLDKVVIRVCTSYNLWWWQIEHYPKNALGFDVNANHLTSARLSTSTLITPTDTSIRTHRVQHGEREFDSLRPYNTGDDLKRIDWKRTATRGSPVVKTYRPESHQRIAIAIDCGRRMQPRVQNRRVLEFAADGAARVLQLASSAEDEVGFFAFNKEVLVNLPCKRGKKQIQMLRSSLQSLQAADIEPDYNLVTNWINKLNKRTLLLLITNCSNPEQLESIKNKLSKVTGKHLPVVFSIQDEALTELALSPVHTTTGAYVVSAAYEQLNSVRQMAKLISHSGFNCIHCKAAELPRQISETYQRLKISGQL